MLSLVLLAGCGGGGGEERPSRSTRTRSTSTRACRRRGASAAVGDAVAAGQRLALADSGSRVGGCPIKLVELDSAEPDERDWDPDRVAENAETRGRRPGRDRLSRRARAGGVGGLAAGHERGVDPPGLADRRADEPDAFRRPGPRAGPSASTRPSRAQLPPARAAGLGAGRAAREPGAAGRGRRGVALAHDGGIYGRSSPAAVEQAAIDRGLEVTTVERVEPDLDEAPSRSRGTSRRSGPGAVIYLGIGGRPGGDRPRRDGGTARGVPLAGRKPARARGRPARRRAGTVQSRRVADAPARQYPSKGRRVLGASSDEAGAVRRWRRSTATSRCAWCSGACAPPGARRPTARR